MHESRVLDELFVNGPHENLIQVLHHGWLDVPNTYYFIDMEFCDFNLEQYIQHDEFLYRPGTSSSRHDKRSPCDIVNIIKQIARGIEFIHLKGKVHRDLCPKNGRFF